MITAEAWVLFLDQVEKTRQLQRDYRRTVDPFTRRKSEIAESLLDTTVMGFRAELALEQEAVALLGAMPDPRDELVEAVLDEDVAQGFGGVYTKLQELRAIARRCRPLSTAIAAAVEEGGAA